MGHEKGVIVSKFGGTSMGSSAAMLNATEIVKSQSSQSRLVVVSATFGTTDRLLNLFKVATAIKADGMTVTLSDLLNDLELKHSKIAEALGSDATVSREISALFIEMRDLLSVAFHEDGTNGAHRSSILDQLLSFGERISSVLFCQALRNLGLLATVFDARKVLRTNSSFGKAEPLPTEISALCKEWLKPLLQTHDVVVTQGFIGSDETGRTTTLGRGGSDLSASLLAEGLDARECQIWTDVAGIYTCDPRLIPSARRIENISFEEAAELANFGAKVLHPATLWPAIRKKIRVFVGSTFSPNEGGTWIHPEIETKGEMSQNLGLVEPPLVRALALRKEQTLITVSSLRMLNAYGFLAEVFSILAKHKVSIDLVTTSEVSVALTVDGTSLGSSGENISQNRDLLKQLEKVAQVKVEENLSLIALIGNQLTSTPGVAAKAFEAIKGHNIRLICHGASDHNLCFLARSEEAPLILKRLHSEFLNSPE